MFAVGLVISLSLFAVATSEVVVSFDGTFEDCSEEKGKYIDFENRLYAMKTDEEDIVIGGTVEVTQTIEGPLTGEVDIYKETDGNYNYVTTFSEENVCDQMGEPDQLWTAFMDEMDFTPKSCPIPAGTYTINEVTTKQAIFREYGITEDDIGNYHIKVRLVRPQGGESEEIVCALVGVVIKTNTDVFPMPG